jgi:tRNA pseudouridine38-40 synthase
MMRYLIEFSYKGTNYCGWQIQQNANSVQAEIEKGLSLLLKTSQGVTGSSRTDTGVHAEQQFAHFDTEIIIEDISAMIYKLNKILPNDIAILSLQKIEDTFHSRFDAISRKYEYRISRKKSPFLFGTSYYFVKDLDIDLMNKSAEILFKHIDYESFSRIKTEVKTFECTIMEARWENVDSETLIFHIKANRFLRGMVRTIVGTMIEIGLGRISVADFEQIIISKNRKNAGRAVPAEGLFLVEVNY